MANLRSSRFGLSLLLFALLAVFVPAAAASPALSPTAGYITGCTGEYFNNTTLVGSPAYSRFDPTINFFWPEGTSPAPGIGVDNYSVRWTCTINVSGDQTVYFNILTDDGMNVLVDGNLVIWAWYDQGPTSYANSIFLGNGTHTVQVQYYNHTLGGSAQVQTSVSSGSGTPPPSITNWKGEYYNNQYLSGSPTVTRDDAQVNFDWGLGSPDPAIPTDHWSARWTRTLSFAAGTWRFTTTTDDGVRLWVDGTLLIDKWMDQSATAYSADIALAAGNHAVKMEYYDDTVNAVAKLSYGQVSGPGPGPGGAWHGQYFNNPDLAGSPVFVRDDPSVQFDWGLGSPGPGVPADYFSVKWDATQNFAVNGNYTVTASSDDGVRVWIDGILMIDAWYDHSATTFTATRYFNAGPHAVHVEYYDRTLYASVSVQISNLGAPPPPPPPPSGEVIVEDGGPGWQSGGFAGYWHDAGGSAGHSFWTFNNTFAVPLYNWARWYPNLPGPGNYEVFAYIPGGIGNTNNARYWVAHGGRFDPAPRNQALYGNQWMSLGIYYFSATGGENVSLSDVTGECYTCRTLVFDAVKFSPR